MGRVALAFRFIHPSACKGASKTLKRRLIHPSAWNKNSRILGSREKFAHAGENAQGSIKTVSNAEPVIERVRSQL